MLMNLSYKRKKNGIELSKCKEKNKLKISAQNEVLIYHSVEYVF